MYPSKGIPLMSTTEYREMALLRRYHLHGDQSARVALVESGMPLVRSIARRYSGRGEQFEDLVQVGLVGLVKAIDRFDVHAGRRFVSFAAPNISGEIKRHFRDHTWAAHVPRSVQELDVKVQRAQEELRAARSRERGRPAEPTAHDVAVHLDEPLDRIELAIQAGRCRRAAPIDAPISGDATVLDALGHEDPALEQVELRQLVFACASELDARERRVVWMRYVRDMLQREIAHEIGVSQMQVSRLLARAVKHMREAANRVPATVERMPLAA